VWSSSGRVGGGGGGWVGGGVVARGARCSGHGWGGVLGRAVVVGLVGG